MIRVVFMAVVVVLLLTVFENSFGSAEAQDEIVADDSESLGLLGNGKEIRDPWVAYLYEILCVTLSDTKKLIRIKKGEKEQQSLKELKAILEEDIADVESGKSFSTHEITVLEYHNDSINLILEAIRKVPDGGNDASVAKTPSE